MYWESLIRPLTNAAQKVHVKPDEIASQKPSRVSVMPEGLLNPLSLEEVADLIAYLNTTP